MARILYQSNVNKIVGCNRCRSIVEYTDKDVRLWTDSDGPGGCGGQHAYIDCPGCRRSIELD